MKKSVLVLITVVIAIVILIALAHHLDLGAIFRKLHGG